MQPSHELAACLSTIIMRESAIKALTAADTDSDDLLVMNDGDGVRLLMDIYMTYVSEYDFKNFPKIMKQVDRMLYAARGNKAFTQEDRQAAEDSGEQPKPKRGKFKRKPKKPAAATASPKPAPAAAAAPLPAATPVTASDIAFVRERQYGRLTMETYAGFLFNTDTRMVELLCFSDAPTRQWFSPTTRRTSVPDDKAAVLVKQMLRDVFGFSPDAPFQMFGTVGILFVEDDTFGISPRYGDLHPEVFLLCSGWDVQELSRLQLHPDTKAGLEIIRPTLQDLCDLDIDLRIEVTSHAAG